MIIEKIEMKVSEIRPQNTY